MRSEETHWPETVASSTTTKHSELPAKSTDREVGDKETSSDTKERQNENKASKGNTDEKQKSEARSEHLQFVMQQRLSRQMMIVSVSFFVFSTEASPEGFAGCPLPCRTFASHHRLRDSLEACCLDRFIWNLYTLAQPTKSHRFMKSKKHAAGNWYWRLDFVSLTRSPLIVRTVDLFVSSLCFLNPFINHLNMLNILRADVAVSFSNSVCNP